MSFSSQPVLAPSHAGHPGPEAARRRGRPPGRRVWTTAATVGCLLLVAGGVLAVWWHPTGTAAPAQAQLPHELHPDLVSRFDQASRAARAEAGLELSITSGWRSTSEQQEIIDQKVAEVGVEAAHRLVAPVEASAHVRGLAIDVGPSDGAAWLGRHGWRFGLCQVYANEPWHFEPTTDPGGTCPPLVPDASALW